MGAWLVGADIAAGVLLEIWYLPCEDLTSLLLEFAAGLFPQIPRRFLRELPLRVEK